MKIPVFSQIIYAMMNAKSLTILLLLFSFISASSQEAPTPVYGKNQITVAPLSAYGSDPLSDVGLGLAYERFVNDKVALYMPLSLGLSNELAQVGIGIKLYPAGHETSVSYSISPLFFFSTGKEEFYLYDPWDYYGGPTTERIYQLGFMLDNSLNITIDEDVYLGVEGGFGVNYLNEWESGDYQYYDGPSLNGNFRINIGYRF